MKKFFKKNAMILVALGIASGTLMSFNILEKSAILEDQYWFEMDASGNIPTDEIPSPSLLCKKEVLKNCARQYNESQTELIGDERHVLPEEIDSPVDWRTRP